MSDGTVRVTRTLVSLILSSLLSTCLGGEAAAAAMVTEWETRGAEGLRLMVRVRG
jgi:hypothetical protein